MNTSVPPNLYTHIGFRLRSSAMVFGCTTASASANRDVEEVLFARGVIITYAAIGQWCRKFGQAYTNQLRRRRPRPGDKWHLDEVFFDH